MLEHGRHKRDGGEIKTAGGGNGSYCKNVGWWLILWYDDPDMIEYFSRSGKWL